MWRCLVPVVAVSGCGSDDDNQAELRPCQVTVSGDATGTDSCRMFLCYPTSNDYESLDLAQATEPVLLYHLVIEVPKPTTFAPGTLTLDQMKPTSQVNVDIGGKHYAARQAPHMGTRDPAETASLVVDALYAPAGDDVCSGAVDGALTASLVEITNAHTPNEAVGPGRLTLSVQLGP
jgi:hypothetical protein